MGLADARGIGSVEIFWPATGQTQRLTGLLRNRGYRIREDASAAVEVARRSFRIKTAK
jgi:hypothetical protein